MKYCFIIGSGCSAANGIPTGQSLASKWYQELDAIYSRNEIEAWKQQHQIDENDLGYHYSQVFEFRFALSPGSGYEAINAEIEKGRTDFGHIILSQLLMKPTLNVVITTNFDTLIEETIYAFTEARPLICGHESIARYAKPSDERPLILKIHRDRFMEPFNLEKEIATLQPEWSGILNKIFANYIPIIIGYGGNDGSLMNYLRYARPCRTMYWCTHLDAPLRRDITEVIDHHNGRIVRIENFNRMMLRLANVYHTVPVDQILKEKVRDQSKRFIYEMLDIHDDVQVPGSAEEKSDAEGVMETFNEGDWWKWEMKVQEAATLQQKLDLYHEALTYLPDSAELNYHFAHLLDDLHRFEESLPYLQKAVQVREDFTDAWLNMGVVYRNMSDYNRAIECYLKAIETQPRCYRAWGNLGFAFHSKGEYTNAIDAYNKSISINPRKAYVWNNLGFTYKAIAQTDKAAEAFDKAIQLEPDLAMPYFNLGNLYIDTDHFVALMNYQKAVERDPDMADAFYNMGLLYEETSQRKQARESFKRAFQLRPNNTDYKAAMDRVGR